MIKLLVLIGCSLLLTGCDGLSDSVGDLATEFTNSKSIIEDILAEFYDENKADVASDVSLEGDTYDELLTLSKSYTYDDYPKQYVEIDVEGLTAEQEALIDLYTEEDDMSFYEYEVDSIGRPVQATSVMNQGSLPTDERPSFAASTRAGGELIGGTYDSDKETWVTTLKGNPTNNAILEFDYYRGYLYNKSHLIAWSLGGNMESENIILGTRSQNVGRDNNGTGGMAAIESEVRAFLREVSDVNVFYQAIPVYEGEEIMPRGVYARAYSLEDGGESIDRAILTFNVQDGIEIDYSTGDWEIIDDNISVVE